MSSDLVILTPGPGALIPPGADKHTRYRVGKFTAWLSTTGRPWHRPSLPAYRDELQAQGMAPATVAAHLSTVRAQYRRLAKDNETRGALYAMAEGLGAADRKAWVDELLTRVDNEIDPGQSTVKTIKEQDQPDAEHVRLTKEQAEALMSSPGLGSLQGLRDTALIVLMLCTGIREAECSALDVADLRQALGGELALHVRQGKGSKARLIPYGELSWCLAIVDKWRQAAGIKGGAVFRGIYKSGARLRPGRLSVRAIEDIITSYPVAIGGELVTVRPHDLRRTYARRLYESGVDLLAIQQNLGHANLKTTLGYIGSLDAHKRRAPAVYSFDLAGLRAVAVPGRLELVT